VFVASRELATLAVCAEAYVSIVATLCACVLCFNVMSVPLFWLGAPCFGSSIVLFQRFMSLLACVCIARLAPVRLRVSVAH